MSIEPVASSPPLTFELAGKPRGRARRLIPETDVRPSRRAPHVDVAALVTAAVETHRIIAESRGIRLLAVVSSAAIRTQGAGLLRIALDNLLVDALSDAPEGATVTAETLSRRERIVLRVRCHGSGRSRALIERALRPFDLPETQRPLGRPCLDMWLVRKIVEWLGGDVRLCEGPAGGCAGLELCLPK